MGNVTNSNIEMEIMRLIQSNFKNLNFAGILKGKEILRIPVESGRITLQSDFEENGTYEFVGSIMISVKINDKDFAEENYLISGNAVVRYINEDVDISITGDIQTQKQF